MPAEPPTAGSLNAMARAVVSASLKASGVAMSGAGAPSRTAMPIGARAMAAWLLDTTAPDLASASITAAVRISTSAVSPAASRACSAPIGSNTISGAAPQPSANCRDRIATAACMERAQNTFSIPAPVSCGWSEARSLFDVFHHPLRSDLGAVDVALGIGCDALGGAGGGGVLIRVRNQSRHRAVPGAADADAALPGAVRLVDRAGLRVGHVDDVVLVDVDAARPAELRPLVDEVSVLIEDLDTVVAAVAKEQPAARIHRQRVRAVHLAGGAALLAPGLDELAGLVKLDDAGVGVAAVTVGDEDIAVGRDQYSGGRIELIRPAPRNAGLAESQQHLAFRAELENLVTLAVLAEPIRHPDVSFRVDREAMRKHEKAGAEAFDQLAGLVEFEDRIKVGSVAGERHARLHLRRRRKGAAALSDPDALAVPINADAGRGAPGAALRQFSERRPCVGIGQRIGGRNGLGIDRAGYKHRCRQNAEMRQTDSDFASR